MSIYLELIITALTAVALSGTIYILDKRTRFGRIAYKKKQIIIGLLFGGLSVLGTELGIEVSGALINVRDAAPLCAGLIFGAPAGIIAGIIGGVERYFAVYWGAGTFTREACSIATITAGFLAGFLRKYMFDDKRPAWFFGPFLAAVTEVFHMLLVFAIHMHDARAAFEVVRACTIPMILLNGSAVWLSLATISFLSAGKRGLKKEASERKLTVIIQRWLLACIMVVFVSSSLFAYVFQTKASDTEAHSILLQNLEDVKADINEMSDRNMLKIARSVKEKVEAIPEMSMQVFQRIAEIDGVSEINYINNDGIITVSTQELFVNYDMNAGDQSRDFLKILRGETDELVQEYGPVSFSDSIYRKYAGIAMEDGGFIQVGYDAERFQNDIAEIVKTEAHNRHVGENGYIVITDRNFNIISDNHHTEDEEEEEHTLDARNYNLDYDTIFKAGVCNEFELMIGGKLFRCMYDEAEGYYIFTVLSDEECLLDRDMSIYTTIFMEVMVFTVLFVIIYILIKRMVVKNIIKVNQSLTKITEGNLDTVVDVRGNEEFASLSKDINLTVDTLKQYIEEAEARIDQELEYARTIQYTSLPHVFPPFPERKEFEIWAGMSTAKEVGGDFYDFYFVDQNKLAFLVADVSGKGIPAALFMMKAKTTIKNLASTGMPVNQVFVESNNNLCENNDAEMFVTAWMGVLNIENGLVHFANAGHNDPLVYHKGEDGFQYKPVRRNLVLAGMDGIPYRINELQLTPGDVIFLYTDGVTEATNEENELYGDDRLKECLDRITDIDTISPEKLCAVVKQDVEEFVGEAPQFDDMTMLCLRYEGN